MITCTNFRVKVIKPAMEEKDGGLKKGARFTVYGMMSEQLIDGKLFIYFLVFNPARGNFMLEPACQFEPCEK